MRCDSKASPWALKYQGARSGQVLRVYLPCCYLGLGKGREPCKSQLSWRKGVNFWWLLPKQTMRSQPWGKPCTLWSLGALGLLLGDNNKSQVSFSRWRFTTQLLLLLLQSHNTGGCQLAPREQPGPVLKLQTTSNPRKWAGRGERGRS